MATIAHGRWAPSIETRGRSTSQLHRSTWPCSPRALPLAGLLRFLRILVLVNTVSVFDAADVVLVDLRAEMPSYCLRPHVQEGGFLARRRAAYDDVEALGPAELQD